MENSNQPNQHSAQFQPPPEPSVIVDGECDTNSQTKPPKKMVVWLGGFLLVLVVLVAGVYLLQRGSDSNQLADQPSAPSSVVIPTSSDISPTTAIEINTNMQMYSNQVFGYSIAYPQGWYANLDSELRGDDMIGTKSSIYFWVSKEEIPGETFKKGVVVDILDCINSLCSSQDVYIQSLKTQTDVFYPDMDSQIKAEIRAKENFEKQYLVEKINISGFPAVRVEVLPASQLAPERYVVVLAEPYLFKIWTPIVDPSDPDYAVFDQMVASFKLQ